VQAWREAQLQAWKDFHGAERGPRAWFSDGFFAGARFMLDNLYRKKRKARK
jgi:hypothetical protein